MPVRKKIMEMVNAILNGSGTTWQEKKELLVDMYISKLKLE